MYKIIYKNLTAFILILISSSSFADVWCKTKSGSVFVRPICKKGEVQLDLLSLGLQGPQGIPGVNGSNGINGGDGIVSVQTFNGTPDPNVVTKEVWNFLHPFVTISITSDTQKIIGQTVLTTNYNTPGFYNLSYDLCLKKPDDSQIELKGVSLQLIPFSMPSVDELLRDFKNTGNLDSVDPLKNIFNNSIELKEKQSEAIFSTGVLTGIPPGTYKVGLCIWNSKSSIDDVRLYRVNSWVMLVN